MEISHRQLSSLPFRIQFFIEDQNSDCKKQLTVAISGNQRLKRLFLIGYVLEGPAWTNKYEKRELQIIIVRFPKAFR